MYKLDEFFWTTPQKKNIFPLLSSVEYTVLPVLEEGGKKKKIIIIGPNNDMIFINT
jgi:hypothetical protein